MLSEQQVSEDGADLKSLALHRITPALVSSLPGLEQQIEQFESREGGENAEEWFKGKAFPLALQGSNAYGTYVVLVESEVDVLFSLRMGEAKFSQARRKKLRLPIHKEPRHEGCVLLMWIANRKNAVVKGKRLLECVLSVCIDAAEQVGAVALALDPQNERLAEYWRSLDFRNTNTSSGIQKRLYLPL